MERTTWWTRRNVLLVATLILHLAAWYHPRPGAAGWIPVGPDGDSVSSFVVDPLNTETIYAATVGGVFKSVDGGMSWKQMNSGLAGVSVSVRIQCLAIDPVDTETLYVGLYRGIFKSTDGGNSWTEMDAGANGYYTIQALAIDPSNPQVLYAAADNGGGVFKSTDGGSSWTNVSKTTTELMGVYSLAIDPLTPEVIYAGGDLSKGIWKSGDSGATWSRLGFTAGGTPYALLIDPQNTQTLYCDTYRQGVANGGAWKSTDGGMTWNRVDQGFTSLYSFVFDPANTQTLYAAAYDGTAYGFYTSSNGGGTWSRVSASPVSTGFSALTVDPLQSQTVYAAPGGYKSVNGGKDWTQIHSGLTTANIGVLAIAPLEPETIFATAGGVFKSVDGGKKWSSVSTGLTTTRITTLAMDTANSQVLYLGTDIGVFKSLDGGTAWSRLGTSPSTNVAALAIDPLNTQIVYAIASGIYKTEDGGSTWNLFVPTSTISGATALAVDPANTRTLYVGTSGGMVYKTVDGGSNWSPSLTTLSALIKSFAMEPGNTRTLYAATYGSGAFKSTDGGVNWQAINSGIISPSLSYTWVYSIAIDPLSPQTLYAGTVRGIFKSLDGGILWTPASSGLASPTVHSLVMDPGNPLTLYAGTEGGSVFKTTDGAADPPKVPGAPTGVTATPRESSATISFSPPSSDGGSPITLYTVTSSPEGKTGSRGKSPITVRGLTNGKVYNFTVTASNAAGTGLPSDPSNSVIPIGTTVPGAPSRVTAKAGVGEATVRFVRPASNGGSPITGYTVTSSPGNLMAEGAKSPIILGGLVNGTVYTFTVTATNKNGAGPASATSNPVRPLGPPEKPTSLYAKAGNGAASVVFKAPASNGGSPITGYTVTSSPDDISVNGVKSPVLVRGLTNGRTYTFTVRATNRIGTGPPSNKSNRVTPGK